MLRVAAMAMIANLCKTVMLQTVDPMDRVRAYVAERLHGLGCTFRFEVFSLGKPVGFSFGAKMNPFDMLTTEEGLEVSFRDREAFNRYFVKDRSFFLLALAHEYGHIRQWEESSPDRRDDPISYELRMRRQAGLPDDYEVGAWEGSPFAEIDAYAKGYIAATKWRIAGDYRDYAERIFGEIVEDTPPYAKEFIAQRIIAARKAMGYT